MPETALDRLLGSPVRDVRLAVAGAIADANALRRRSHIERKRGEAGIYAQRAAYLNILDEALPQLLHLAAMREETRKKLLTLAKLASPEPMFDNPIVIWEAQRLRDDILRAAGLIQPTTGA